MLELMDLVLESAKAEGYGFTESLKIWNDFRAELNTYPVGKNTVRIGKREINFTISRKAE